MGMRRIDHLAERRSADERAEAEVSSAARGMVFVLMFGAALYDHPEKRLELAAAADLLDDRARPMQDALTALYDAVGHDWSPKGQWRERIVALKPELGPLFDVHDQAAAREAMGL